jgi:ATPase subunit of ABC transporter with duplicated ATPase domains
MRGQGNYSTYLKTKRELDLQAERDMHRQRKEVAHLEVHTGTHGWYGSVAQASTDLR